MHSWKLPTAAVISNTLASTLFVFWLGVFCMLLTPGCMSASPNPAIPPNNGPISPPTAEINRMLASAAMNENAPLLEDYRIGPEDTVQITLFNLSGVDGGVTPRDISLRLSQQGIIKLPLLGELKVAGLTTSGLEDLLRRRYEKYIYDPEVSVQVREFRSQRVYLLGSIARAGAIELTGPKTLIDVLAMVGGVSQGAGNQVHIYRQTPEGRTSYVIDLHALASSIGLINAKTVGAEVLNMLVQSGDIINVPEAGTFFVDGAVGRPGPFPLGRRYTLTQAIALAGGTNQDLADYSNITIYRTINNEVKKIQVDLNAIRDGTEPDLVMQADDFLYVPISGLKWVWNFFLKDALHLPNMIPGVPAIAAGS
jgi:polysaccharide export outer membrane protein